MDKIETKRVLILNDGEARKLDEAYMVLDSIYHEIYEESDDIIVDDIKYTWLDIKTVLGILDAITEANDIKVVKGEKLE